MFGKSLVCIAGFALLVMSCSSAPSDARTAEYYSSDRGTVLILSGDKGYLGQNPAAPDLVGETVQSMKLLTPLDKPAMEAGSCVGYEHFTIAIRKGASADASYRCNGIGFRVTRCDASPVPCRNFEVEARCFNFQGGKCSPEGDAGNLTFAYVFRYDLERGLLWVDFAPGHPGSDVLRLAGERGFRL